MLQRPRMCSHAAGMTTRFLGPMGTYDQHERLQGRPITASSTDDNCAPCP
ncbi:hypothetical protein NB697_003099 [Xanthomonas sacchari]|nr:hypothetical protein [Xanthomonas sacchari]MCW0436205.1 hypothetical protein [Xanthomonas sacchari]